MSREFLRFFSVKGPKVMKERIKSLVQRIWNINEQARRNSWNSEKVTSAN